MSDEGTTPRVTVWVGEDHVPTLEDILGLGRIGIAGIGGSGPLARELADRQGHDFTDDIRLLARTEAAAFALMDPGSRLPTESLVAVLQAGSDANRPILSMTPRPGLSPDQVGESSTVLTAGPLPRPIPRSRSLTWGRRLSDAVNDFGPPSAASIEISGPSFAGAVGTRLYDAFELLSEWFGFPATIRAISTTVSATPTMPEGETVFVMASYPDGRAASIQVGAVGGRVHRSATLTGAGGRLQMADGGLDWSGPRGEGLDFEPPSKPAPGDFADEVAECMLAEIDGIVAHRPLEDSVDLLAACEATLLSLRTGEPESHDSVRQMLERV